MTHPQSSSLTKVCPLCGSRFGAEVERCPTDGRILIRVRKGAASEGGAADGEKGGSVRLSSATEELLGDILTSAEDSVDVKGGSTSSNVLAELAGDLDFDIDIEFPGSGETAKPSSSSIARLKALEGFADPFDKPKDGGSKDDDASERNPRSGAGAAAALFDDLALEVDGLEDIDPSDNEVTRRVIREDLNMEATRRSEMPPEFAEALARERAEEAAAAAAAADGEEEDASSAEKDAEASEAAAESEGEDEDAPSRAIPRYSQLQVKSVSYVLSREKRPSMLPLIAIALAVILLVLVIVFVVI